MLGFITKKLIRSSIHKAAVTCITKSTKTLKLKTFFSSSSVPISAKVDDFTTSYLIHSCGLRPDSAKNVSRNFKLKPTDQPDKTLNFFKRCNFTSAEICNIVRRQPKLLLADVELSLQSKFEVLACLDVPRWSVLRLICECPGVLEVENLEDVLLVLKRFVRGDEVLKLLGRVDCGRCGVISNLVPNVTVLLNVGMTDYAVREFLRRSFDSVLTDPKRFKEMAYRALDMEFDPKDSCFMEAICAFAGVDGETWEMRAERFKKWGWSNEDCDEVERKEPRLMLVSEKRFDAAMDYLVNYLGVKQSVVAGCLDLLEYNIDKRIIPLCLINEFVDALSNTPDRLRDKYDRALTKMFKTEKKHSGGASKPFDTISVETWELKVDRFVNRWGWSHEEFLAAFRNHPRMMLVSQNKIDGIMEFFVNKMGLDASLIAEHPNILKYSLEQRIIPRWSVVELLMSKGVVERKDHNMYYLLRISDETFVKTFVKKHEKILPELMDLYSQKQLAQ